MIRLLLSHGAEPHAQSASGKTPYHLAIESGHQEAARMVE